MKIKISEPKEKNSPDWPDRYAITISNYGKNAKTGSQHRLSGRILSTTTNLERATDFDMETCDNVANYYKSRKENTKIFSFVD